MSSETWEALLADNTELEDRVTLALDRLTERHLLRPTSFGYPTGEVVRQIVEGLKTPEGKLELAKLQLKLTLVVNQVLGQFRDDGQIHFCGTVVGTEERLFLPSQARLLGGPISVPPPSSARVEIVRLEKKGPGGRVGVAEAVGIMAKEKDRVVPIEYRSGQSPKYFWLDLTGDLARCVFSLLADGVTYKKPREPGKSVECVMTALISAGYPDAALAVRDDGRVALAGVKLRVPLALEKILRQGLS